ncbi:DUF465 domain-containing protein [Croceicoccus naphthovorans]|uniref:DUF465 domain-containing protein n=1 Tax=Croceicoccus naphthovorans TaxID=1348774 RepID=UPI000B2BF979|nr:DUF465 domain-containing protein [Croceicoccus naphthovorans]MBB3989813.1 hypothetical protein [Croceicoccus naphthovorans]
MSDRFFRLLERLQRLDDQLRRAQRTRRDRLEIARLALRKAALKNRLRRLSSHPLPIHA